MSVFRATNDNLPLTNWLNDMIWPMEAKLTCEDVYKTSLLSCIELIKTGTTTANDMYFHGDGVWRAMKEAKIRGIFPLYCIGDDNDALFKEFEHFYSEHKDDELLGFAVSPHSFYTCSKELIEHCKKLADKYNLPIHTHFCEDEGEVQTIKKKYGMDPADVLKSFGLLENKLILAHCTFISESDAKKICGHDVSFVHNPLSNLNLGCGIADLIMYKKHGINICLGTDGQGSGNNMNLFRHMMLVDLLQKGKNQDTTVMPSYDVLKMATIDGARALGIDDKVGSIEVGKKADIIMLDISDTESYPAMDLIVQIVHNVESKNVDMTMINGEILMQGHKLTNGMDEEILKKDIDRIVEKLLVAK